MAGDHDDSDRDPAGEQEHDPDRAAILARRRRFIAIAISGLATTACKSSAPEPCLSMVNPDADTGEEPSEPSEPSQPFVEDPGVPLDEASETGETGEAPEPTPEPQPRPQPCLKKAAPRPCLNVANHS